MSTAAIDLEISNIALSKVGVPSITSLSENSAEARAVSEQVASCRDFVFQTRDWGALRKRRLLTYDPVATPEFGFLYAAKLPSDFVTLRSLTDVNEAIVSKFEIEGEYILSDEEELHLLYTSNDYLPSRISAAMKEAAGYYLAYSIAFKLRPEERPSLFQAYTYAINEARRVDLRNRPVSHYAKGKSETLSRFI